MPIRFRCSYCNRLLGIATRKAGMETICPHCGYTITVPVPQEDDGRTERINLEDVEELLGNAVTENIAPQAAVAAAPAAPPVEEPPRAEAPRPPVPVYPRPVSPPAAAVAPPAPPPAPKVRPAPPPVPKPAARSSDDPPLFEGDMDAILGTTKPPAEPERAKPPAVSGLDAMSLGDPAQNIVISGQKATFLLLLVVVLMLLSFVAGYVIK